jgi:class 3 adenylate cyclase
VSKNSQFEAKTLKKVQPRESESTEVSYTVLDNVQKEDIDSILQKIATAINVQLTLPDGGEIPYVPFDGFNNAIHEDKVYLYGTSGSGKSRTIFEIIKSKVAGFERIFIINPRNVITGSESGRIDVYELADQLTESDAILWDNFPDDLVKKNIDSASKVMEIISSKNVKNLLVALKPKYLEFYRDIVIDVPELYKHQLSYDKEKIRSIVKLYGTKTGFKQLYEKYLVKDLDKISKTLWEKEPTPLTVLDYYKELSNKESQKQYKKLKEEEEEEEQPLNAVAEAESLLRSIQYYEHQFDYISTTEERHSDAEFLYTLRLCYEIGRDRNIDSVEKLQKDIFNSEPPKHASRNLSTWVYLSGQYYAMHDAARQSIKFDDYVKMQIMKYLTNNFLQIVPKEKNQVYSFAVFFGKNFQYVSRDESHLFLPEHIYQYMKANRYFENCIGYGIGESFSSLDDDLQQLVLDRLGIDSEFAEGFGYSLGLHFSSLDDTHRHEIFKRIYSGTPFAWLFGESLGRIFSYLSEDVRREIFEHIKKNTMFANGVGRGLGYTYPSFDSNLQQEIFERAKTNSELTLGLGIGLGKNYSSLNRQLQMEILEKGEKNYMFDQGLGLGFGLNFEQSTKEFQRWALEIAERRVQLMFCMAFSIGSAFSYSSEEFQRWALERADKDAEFAYGFGFGMGYAFSYLSANHQKEMFVLIEKNKKFAYGLGCGFGLVFNFLPKEFKYNILAIADKNIDFDQGLGFGIGLPFAYLEQRVQQEVFERAEKNVEFSYGLGTGLGYTLTYLTTDLQAKILAQSEKNKDLRTGLGSGAAFSFSYQTEQKQLEIFSKIDRDAEFAKGSGMHFGRHFKYFPANIQNKIFEKVEENPLFSYGIGYGIGYVFPYHANDLQKEIFERASKNAELALGLGHGLGHTLMYFGSDVQKEIFERAEHEPEFAYGLGYGLGRSFKYLPKEIKNEITARSTHSIQLATGFGGGIGSILFKYFSKEEQEDIFQNAIAATDSGFSRGIGTGIGRTFKYLDKQQQEDVLRKADENSEFAIGLGLGLGFVYQFNELPENLSKKVNENTSLARGYGEGLGHLFKYVNQQVKILEEVTEDNRLSRGIGTGIGRTFKYLDKQQQEDVLRKADENSEFAIGLGLGLGITFNYLDRRQKEEVLRKATEYSHHHFGKGFNSGISYIFKYISRDSQTELFEKMLNQEKANEDNRSSTLAQDLGLGLGHNFPSLKEEIQEEVLMWAHKNKEFAKGLGQGLARSFKYLSEISQDEILQWIGSEQNGKFSKALALGLGHNFPSLKERIQQKILEIAEQDAMFLSGLGQGLARSFKYLHKEVQGQILTLADKNQSFSNAFHEADTIKIEVPQIYNDFPVIGLHRNEEYAAAPSASENNKSNILTEEVSFSGLRENYCICYIDMMNSTKIAAELTDVQISKYYSIFLNSMATIARNFGAKIIKNAGDCLIFYFPQTSDSIANNAPFAFKDVIECCLTMVAAHRAMNAKLSVEQLPPLNYRISADYGKVEVVKSATSQSDDLFGSTMNICAKINAKAAPNGIVIGNNMYLKTNKMFEQDYLFQTVGEYSSTSSSGSKDDGGSSSSYPIYSVESKQKRNILNPFKRTSSSSSFFS